MNNRTEPIGGGFYGQIIELTMRRVDSQELKALKNPNSSYVLSDSEMNSTLSHL